MYRKIKAEIVPLTMELATQFVEMAPLPGERALRPSRLQYLETQVLNHKFSGPDWAVGFCRADGKLYRLDGQHSSKKLSKLPEGVTFPAGLLATVTTYEFDSMADAADLFNLFDNPKRTRSTEDVMGVFSAQVSALDGYDREFLVHVANGLHEFELQRKRKGAKDAVLFPSRDRGLYWTRDDRPEFLASVPWLDQFRTKKNKTFLDKAVIVSEMIAYRRDAANAGLANEFWDLVFTESHPDPEHESRILAETFREMLAVAKQPKIDPNLLRKKAQRAWKSFKATADMAFTA